MKFFKAYMRNLFFAVLIFGGMVVFAAILLP